MSETCRRPPSPVRPSAGFPVFKDGRAEGGRAISALRLYLSWRRGPRGSSSKPAFPLRQVVALVGEAFVIEAQEEYLSPSSAIRRPIHLVVGQPTLVRNSRVLICLSYLGSVAALGIGLGMVVVAFTCFFPLGALNLDRFAAGALWLLGAWLMAMSQVFLWRQGELMSHCSVLLDTRGAHFKLGSTASDKEVFMPWNRIEAVHYKRIESTLKFTILGKDTSTVTFTSYSFYRPKRVARLIAARAGLPLVRG